MTENLTRQHGLVQEITNKGWFANPAGKQGYEVILLERVGDGGTRFYHSLKPGETLRVAERLLASYIALQVDMRHARAFPVSGLFNTVDRGKKVTLELNVRYHVTNAQIIAIDTVDPLGELQSKILATLNRELLVYAERDVNPLVIESIVQNVGQFSHLGLTVENVEVTSFTSDSRITQHVVEEEDVRHSVVIDSIKHHADIEARKELHSQINLSNLNVFMHEFPNLAPRVLATFSERDRKLLDAQISTVQESIRAYIAHQNNIDGEIDPREIGNILREAIDGKRPQLQVPTEIPQIAWGDEMSGNVDDEIDDAVIEEKKNKPTEKKNKPSKKNPHIKFGG